MFRISPERPGDHSAGRPGSAGSDAPKPGASASFDAPSRYLSALAFLGDRTGGGPSVARAVVPGDRSGAGLCLPRRASTASRPASMTPHEYALGGRDGQDYNQP